MWFAMKCNPPHKAAGLAEMIGGEVYREEYVLKEDTLVDPFPLSWSPEGDGKGMPVYALTQKCYRGWLREEVIEALEKGEGIKIIDMITSQHVINGDPGAQPIEMGVVLTYKAGTTVRCGYCGHDYILQEDGLLPKHGTSNGVGIQESCLGSGRLIVVEGQSDATEQG